MSKLKKNENGFSVVESLLILIIVGLIGFVGWYVWHSRAINASGSTTSTKTSSTSDTSAPYKACTLSKNATYNVLDGCQILGSTKVITIPGVKKDSGASDAEGSAIHTAMNTFCQSSSPSGTDINTGTGSFFREGDFAELSTGCKMGDDFSGYRVVLKKASGTWRVLTNSQMAFNCGDLDGQGIPSYFTICNAGNGIIRSPSK